MAEHRSADRFVLVLAAIGAAAGCGSDEQSIEPEPSTPVVTEVATTTEESAAGTPIRTGALVGERWWLGRWEAEGVEPLCVELRADGTSEVSFGGGHGPKIVVTARYDVRDESLELTPTRIHQMRWIGPCRRRVEGERDLEAARYRRIQLDVGQTTALVLRRTDEGIALCVEEDCTELRPAPEDT